MISFVPTSTILSLQICFFKYEFFRGLARKIAEFLAKHYRSLSQKAIDISATYESNWYLFYIHSAKLSSNGFA